MTRRSPRALHRRLALALSLILVVSTLAVPALAEDDTGRSYTAELTPESEVCDGVETMFTLTLTNTSSQQRLGSARVEVPDEVAFSYTEDLRVSQQRGRKTDPIASYDAGVISLDDLSAAPDATVTVTFTATATLGEDDDPSVEFTTRAKQANDFNSTSETANELVLIGDQPTTTIVSCGTLAFIEQPGDTSVGVPIPGFDGSAGPRVAIVDEHGTVIPTASASITIALAEERPAGAELDGELTQETDGGVATFAGLSINSAGTYELTASAAGFDGDVSEDFEVFAFGATCDDGDVCTTTLDAEDGSTSLSGTADGRMGSLLGSSEAKNGVAACGNPMDYDVNDYSYLPSQVTMGGTNLVDKRAVFTVSREFDQQEENNGVAFYQVCAEPLAPFTEFSTFVDIFGNVVVNPEDTENLRELGFLDENDDIKKNAEFQTSGFLPDCSGADDTPCVESRVKRGGGPLITVRWGSRWRMG